MAEQVSFVVKPSKDGFFPINDAMQQILDAFGLLTMGSTDIIWNIVYASINSPLKIIVEAAPSSKPNVDVDAVAKYQKSRLVTRVGSLIRENDQSDVDIFREDIADVSFRSAEQFFKKPQTIAVTTIDTLDGKQPLTIDKAATEYANKRIELYKSRFNREHIEVGSIEGTLEMIGTHYKKPSINVKDRKTGSTVRCDISEETREQIAQGVHAEDVWRFHRVIVRGIIYYDRSGQVRHIDARRVDRVIAKGMSVSDLRDSDFTGGLEPVVYLDRLREGELG